METLESEEMLQAYTILKGIYSLETNHKPIYPVPAAGHFFDEPLLEGFRAKQT